jgi:hypothetical protein
MRILFSFFLLVFISVQGFSQNGFNKHFDPSTRMARCIDTIDDGYMVMGNISNGYVNTWLMRLDANGDTLWTKTYGTDSIQFKTYHMYGCADGGFILCGDYQQVITWPNMDSYVMKIDSAGNVIWFNRYGVALAQGGGKDFGIRCSELANGTIITSGWARYFYNQNDSFMGGNYFQGLVNSFDQSGNRIHDRSFSLMFTSDTADYWSNTYITYDMKTIGNKIFVTYRDSTGAHLMGLDENLDTIFTRHLSAAISPYFGMNRVNNDQLLVYSTNYLANYDTSGQLLWQINPSLTRVTQVHEAFNGNITILSGYDMRDGYNEADPYIMQYSWGKVILSYFTPNGVFISSDTLLDISPVSDAVAFDFVNTVDSSIAFAGCSYGKFWVVKLDSNTYVPSGITPIYQSATIKIYPNPAHDVLFIEGLSRESKIIILSVDGKVIREFQQMNDLSERTSINFDAISPGLYFLEITDSTGGIELVKFIIE